MPPSGSRPIKKFAKTNGVPKFCPDTSEVFIQPQSKAYKDVNHCRLFSPFPSGVRQKREVYDYVCLTHPSAVPIFATTIECSARPAPRGAGPFNQQAYFFEDSGICG